MKAIPMTINGMMVSQIINFSLSIISPTLLDEIHSSSSNAKMPFLVIFSQRRRPNNPVVKIRIKPVIPSMSARWYLVNSCRPTIARNIPIPAPVVLLELDITNLGCPFMTLAFCRHHLLNPVSQIRVRGLGDDPYATGTSQTVAYESPLSQSV